MRTISVAELEAAYADELRSYSADYTSAGPIRWLPDRPRGPRVPRRRTKRRRHGR